MLGKNQTQEKPEVKQMSKVPEKPVELPKSRVVFERPTLPMGRLITEGRDITSREDRN